MRTGRLTESSCPESVVGVLDRTPDSPELAAWLARLEQRNPRQIELGLERSSRVLERLGLKLSECAVITLAGTNGKGSTAGLLESIYRAAGYRVLCYTSPHILRFRERIRIDGLAVSDETIVAAMDQVEAARGVIPLTYFEHTTLAALVIASDSAPDVLILEVGLGGRLDAVNIVDPDVAVVTSVDLDHQDWLGETRDAIGREKAGIARPGRPLVVADPDPPAGLLAAATLQGARIVQAGRDFAWHRGRDGWQLQVEGQPLDLALPRSGGSHQLGNAAAAWVAAKCLYTRLPVASSHLATALAETVVPGRFQQVGGEPEIRLDVAHNPQAARSLAALLQEAPARTLAVFAMLGDKDAHGVAQALDEQIDHWYCATLAGARGRTGPDLAAGLRAIPVKAPVEALESVAHALDSALASAGPQDRVLVFGSFLAVGEALDALKQ